MSRRDITIILIIIFVAIIIVYLLNWLLSTEGFIPTEFTSSEWLAFWATYITGIFAVIVGYLAISFTNKNSEKAQQQQTEVLRQQEDNKIKTEILSRIKKQYDLFNLLEHCSAIYSIDQMDNSALLQRLVDDRARLHKECNTWTLFVSLYLQSSKVAECVDEYQRCWDESTDILDEFLKIQIQFLQKVQIHDRAIYCKNIYDMILTIYNQKSNSLFNAQSESILYDINQFRQDCEKQQNMESDAKDEIKRLISQIEVVLNILKKAQDNMERASILFLKRINLVDFTKI